MHGPRLGRSEQRCQTASIAWSNKCRDFIFPLSGVVWSCFTMLGLSFSVNYAENDARIVHQKYINFVCSISQNNEEFNPLPTDFDLLVYEKCKTARKIVD